MITFRESGALHLHPDDEPVDHEQRARDAELVVSRPDDDHALPILVSVPHAGRRIPDALLPRYRVDTDTLARDGDLWVDRLYEGVEALGATSIASPWSRFVVDLNRLRDDVSARAVAGAISRKADGYYGARGVIWAITTRGEPIYHQPLPRAEFNHRIRSFWVPYHRFLRDELRAMRNRFGFAVLLDAHSMPSRAAAMHPDAGALRADIVPGDLDGTACAPWLSESTHTAWREAGFGVTPNHPYRGGAIVRLYGRPRLGVHAIQLELNRALYMDELTLDPNDGFAALQRRCLDWVARVADEVRERLPR